MNPQQLKTKIDSIEGKDYGSYQSLIGEYDFPAFRLIIERIPKDPYAPSHTGIYRIIVNRADKEIIDWKMERKITQIAFRDYLNRLFYDASASISQARRGTGNSGLITISRAGQAILERNSVLVDEKHIEIRCFAGLPAKGRRINASIAKKMLLKELPLIVRRSLFAAEIDLNSLKKHIETAEDADFLRRQLKERNLTAFIANGSLLPRANGLSDKPASKDRVIPFLSPKSMETAIKLPHYGMISGMGIPRGVTLIIGGGFHGKSTLLEAIEMGIYNHIPDDGREFCVSLPQTVKIRAYSGRSIVKTDISPFIDNLPFNKNTKEFCSENASGSTSQAAAIIEAMEIGAELFLMDEDTCAANFMIRDEKMRRLVKKQDEPITPFIERIRELYLEKNISTILVLGGSGDYFKTADHIIQMRGYYPLDVTEKAQVIAGAGNSKRETAPKPIFNIKNRIPIAESIQSSNQYKKKRILAPDMRTILFGEQKIDLTDLEQFVEIAQIKAIGFALDYAKKYMNGKRTLQEIVYWVNNDINKKGLDVLINGKSGDFAKFRAIDLAAAINRLRRIEMIQKKVQI